MLNLWRSQWPRDPRLLFHERLEHILANHRFKWSCLHRATWQINGWLWRATNARGIWTLVVCAIVNSSNTGIVLSIPILCIDIYLRFWFSCWSCIIRGLAKGQSSVQGVLPSVYKQDSEIREARSLGSHGSVVEYERKKKTFHIYYGGFIYSCTTKYVNRIKKITVFRRSKAIWPK
jgi:hypothetical protein